MAEVHALQVAQVLADLNDLNIADPTAAHALVTANQNLHRPHLHSLSTSTSTRTPSTQPRSVSQSLSSSQTSFATASNSPGRATTPLSRLPLQRASSSAVGDAAAAAAAEDVVGSDPDLQRARQLLALHQAWSTAPQQQMAGLEKARANVEEIAAKYGWLAAQAKNR